MTSLIAPLGPPPNSESSGEGYAGDHVSIAHLYSTLTDWLRTLGELGSELNHFDRIGEFLDHVAATAVTMLGYDYAMVMTMDAGGVLRSAGSYGLTQEYVRNVMVPGPRAGRTPWTPIREAFANGVPSMVPDVEREPRLRYFHQNFRRQGVRSYASFPLLSRDGCLGVFTVYLRRRHQFGTLEITLMSALAGFAASAVQAATLRQERNARLAEQQGLLRHRERAAEIHQSLMQVVLSRRGLVGISAALSDLLEGAVLFEDLSGRVLATASRDEERRDIRVLVDVAARPRPVAVQTAGASHATRVTTEGGHGDHRVHVMPVMVDGTVTGLLWSITSGELDDSLVHQALEYGALAAALHMLGEQVQQQTRQRTDAELLTEVLALRPGDPVEDLQERASRLGYYLDGPQDVVFAGSVTERMTTEQLQRLHVALRVRLAGEAPAVFVAPRGHGVCVLVPHIEHRSRDPLTATVAEVEQAISNLDASGEWSVVIAGRCERLDMVEEQVHFAENLLRLAARTEGCQRVIDGRRLGIYRLLLAVPDISQLVELRESTLGPLLAYDAAHRSNLVGTLACFLRHKMRAKETAKALVIHVNSLAYRLRRIEEIVGVEVKAPTDLLHLQFALQVDAVLRGGPDAAP